MSLEEIKNFLVNLCVEGLLQFHNAVEGIIIQYCSGKDTLLAAYLPKLGKEEKSICIPTIPNPEEILLHNTKYVTSQSILEIIIGEEKSISLVVQSISHPWEKILDDAEQKRLNDFLESQCSVKIHLPHGAYKGMYALENIEYEYNPENGTLSTVIMQLKKIGECFEPNNS